MTSRQYGHFFVINHQGKADVLVHALESRGWKKTRRPEQAWFLLSDIDIPPLADRLLTYHKAGVKIFLYPHAARPNVFHDFDGYPPFPHITASFVVSPGHIEILEAIRKSHRLEPIGWFLCPIRPFRPRKSYRKVIFAPIHPNADGSLSEMDKTLNQSVLRRLIPLVQAKEIELTVRYIRGLEQNGLWIEPGVYYDQVMARVSTVEMDEADLVVSHQTYAHLAVARGVPTVMMGEETPPRIGSPIKGDFRHARSWEKYKHLLMYPLDILAESDTLALFRRAIASDTEIVDWRRRLIGEPFDRNRFVDTVESYL